DGKNRGFIDAKGKLLARVAGNLAAFGQSAEGPAPASAQWGFASTYSEGYALVSKPGSETTGPYGVVDASGRLVLEPGLLDIDPDWGIQSGLVVIRGSGGATTGGPTTSETTTGGGASGTKGVAPGTAGGPFYGLASVDGLVLREPDLLEIGLFAAGFAPAKGSNGLWGFMDKTGIWRVAPEYDEVGYFSEGLAYARMDGNIPLELFLDTTGSHKFLLISNHPLVPYRFSEGLAACSAEGNKIVFIDRSGKPAFPAAPWKDALPFSEGLAAVRDSDGWKFIDKNGSIAIPGPFEKLMPFSGGLAAAKRGSSWGYIDSSGSWIIQPAFADAWPFGPEGLAQVRLSSGALGWIDKKGNPIWIPAEPAKASQEAATPQGATPPQAAPAKPVLPPQAATRQKAWKEDFSSNAAGWPLGTSEAAEYKLLAGRYRLAGKTDAGALALVPLDFDRSADYSLSAALRHDSGGADDSMGLVWEADSAGRLLVFALSPDGAYAVLDVLPEATNLYVPWTAHKAIKPGPSDNRLEVRRRGQKLEFWINGTMVKSLPHFGISGTGVGFICFYANAISVDDLILGK
ncbi:MAG TPA: WG repeat-containing protein, partial [Rectinemataceae bacterium]